MSTCPTCKQEIPRVGPMVPDDYPSCWDAEVLDEAVDEILVRLIPDPTKTQQHPAVGKSAWVYRSELCSNNTLVHKGDMGLLSVAGWVAESNDWM